MVGQFNENNFIKFLLVLNKQQLSEVWLLCQSQLSEKFHIIFASGFALAFCSLYLISFDNNLKAIAAYMLNFLIWNTSLFSLNLNPKPWLAVSKLLHQLFLWTSQFCLWYLHVSMNYLIHAGTSTMQWPILGYGSVLIFPDLQEF